MDTLQRMELDELLEMTAHIPRDTFAESVDPFCLVVEIPGECSEDQAPVFVLPHKDTLESGGGFRRCAPKAKGQYALFLRKQDDSSHRDMYTVGRSSSCDLTIPHMSISKQHAYLQNRKGEFLLHDPSSTNGTFVEGTQVESTQGISVKSTTAIRFGDVATYLFSSIDLYDYLDVIRRSRE